MPPERRQRQRCRGSSVSRGRIAAALTDDQRGSNSWHAVQVRPPEPPCPPASAHLLQPPRRRRRRRHSAHTGAPAGCTAAPGGPSALPARPPPAAAALCSARRAAWWRGSARRTQHSGATGSTWRGEGGGAGLLSRGAVLRCSTSMDPEMYGWVSPQVAVRWQTRHVGQQGCVGCLAPW